MFNFFQILASRFTCVLFFLFSVYIIGFQHSRRSIYFKQTYLKSIQQNNDIQISSQSCGFLKNIVEYGNNRMARRAVGILQKMPAYKQQPTEVHYNAAIWACEKSSQYELAKSVADEMRELCISFTSSTFSALISLSEKTNHDHDAISYLDCMIKSNMARSTEIYNTCLLVAKKLKDYDDVLSYIIHFENDEDITNFFIRDKTFYYNYFTNETWYYFFDNGQDILYPENSVARIQGTDYVCGNFHEVNFFIK